MRGSSWLRGKVTLVGHRRPKVGFTHISYLLRKGADVYTSDFATLFEECVEAPLTQKGFQRYKKTKTLIFTNGITQVALIRLGGKFSRPGCITQSLCFRHTFLRPIDVDDPVAFTLEANDYPYNLSMQEFAEPTMGQPRYQSMNLGRWPRHSYCFEGVDPKVVRRDLTFLKDLLVDKVVPWASQMTPDIVAAQIKKHGEGAWCERRWLEDYDAHLSASAV